MNGVGTDLAIRNGRLTAAERARAETIAHSTHLEALAWAAGRAGPGAVLEVGTGWFSTPWLHGWCQATSRFLVSIETEPDWTDEMERLYGSATGHQFTELARGVIWVPPERFALVLVDGINEDRAAWLAAIRAVGTATIVVCHDVERTRDNEMPGMAEALNLYPHRRDFDRVFPHTAVLWN